MTRSRAEYQRMYKLGFKEEKLKEILIKTGFKKVDIFYDWYAGQGTIIQKSNKKHKWLARARIQHVRGLKCYLKKKIFGL